MLNKNTHPKLYNSWRGMRYRCSNPNATDYKWYGGKGITVHKDWARFKQFAIWALNNGYKDGLSIERISSDKNYEPSNCIWITKRDNTIDGNSHRYRADYIKAHVYWRENYCTGVELASYIGKTFSVTCGWIRGWKANNNQLVPPGEVTRNRKQTDKS